MERSDEARREDGLYDQIGSLSRNNRKLEKQIKELEGNKEHPENYCHLCGGKNISWYVDNELWNKVTKSEIMPGGICCPLCFVKLAEKKGIKPTAWRLSREGDVPEVDELRLQVVNQVELIKGLEAQISAYENCSKNHSEKCPDVKCWVQELRDKQMDEIEKQAERIKLFEDELNWWHELINKHHKNRSCPDLKTYVENLQKQIKILKDIIIERQMAKLCWCDKCIAKGRDAKKERERLYRELDALVIVKELQNGKSTKDDI